MRDTRRTRLVLAALLLAALTFIVLDVRGGSGSLPEQLRGVGAAIFGPVERAATAVVRPVANFIDGLTSINSNRAKMAELQKQNADLQLQLHTSTLDANRLQQFDDLLHVAGVGRYRIVPAQVVGVASARGFIRTVTIDAGAQDGLKLGQTVINGQGLVGRVTSLGPSSATVLLATDPSFTVGARLASSMEMGAVTGQGSDPMSLVLFNPQALVRPGDALVTLGISGNKAFIPGIPIGEVYKVEATPGALSRTALVKPYVSFTTLDVVGVVVQPPRHDPRNSVLPPSPSPSTTTSPSPSSTTTGTPGATTSGSPSPSPS